jgi:hypothetical protein
MGKVSEVSAPHYFTLDEIVDEPTEQDKEQKEAQKNELEASYTCSFTVPEHLSGKNLEIHLPGPSADDTVYLNGKKIGEGRIDPQKERNYEADPLRWPNLPTRHYPIPDGLLRPGANDLEIKLNGNRIAAETDKRFGLTRMPCLREQTPPALQKNLAAYNTKMEFFRPVVEGPRAVLSLEFPEAGEQGSMTLQLRNTGGVTAMFIILDLAPAGDTRFTFDQGALSALHPGETETIHLELDGPLSSEATLTVRCLNGDPLQLPLPSLFPGPMTGSEKTHPVPNPKI